MSNKKNTILNIFISLILVLLIIIIILIIVKYYNRYENEKKLKKTIETIYNQTSSYNDADDSLVIDTKYKGYDVWGIIKIEKINLEYPILDSLDEKALKTSIIKFFESKNDNQITNLTLAGHNNYDNTMFGNLNKLENGDVVEIIYKNTMSKKFVVYNTYIADPVDVSYTGITNTNNTNELTLVTCKNGNKKRYIVKAKEYVN